MSQPTKPEKKATRMSASLRHSQNLVDKCGNCLKKVAGNESGVRCELRDIWFHCRCKRIPVSLYEALKQHGSDLHWFCASCKSGASKFLTAISSMPGKIEQLEEDIAEIRDECKAEVAQITIEVKKDLNKRLQAITENNSRTDQIEETITRSSEDWKVDLSKVVNDLLSQWKAETLKVKNSSNSSVWFVLLYVYSLWLCTSCTIFIINNK